MKWKLKKARHSQMKWGGQVGGEGLAKEVDWGESWRSIELPTEGNRRLSGGVPHAGENSYDSYKEG